MSNSPSLRFRTANNLTQVQRQELFSKITPAARRVPTEDGDSDDDDYDESGSSCDDEENGIDAFENKPGKRTADDSDSSDSDYETASDDSDGDSDGNSDDDSDSSEESSPSPRKRKQSSTKTTSSPVVFIPPPDEPDYTESDLWKQLQEFKNRPASPATKRVQKPSTDSKPSSPLASTPISPSPAASLAAAITSSPLTHGSTPTLKSSPETSSSTPEPPGTPLTVSSPVVSPPAETTTESKSPTKTTPAETPIARAVPLQKPVPPVRSPFSKPFPPPQKPAPGTVSPRPISPRSISPRASSLPQQEPSPRTTPEGNAPPKSPSPSGGGLVSNSPFRQNDPSPRASPRGGFGANSVSGRAKISSEPNVSSTPSRKALGSNDETPPSAAGGALASRAAPANWTPVSELPPPKQRPVEAGRVAARGAALEATIRSTYVDTKNHHHHKVKSVEYPASPRGGSVGSVVGAPDWTATIPSKPLPPPPSSGGKKPLPPPPPGSNVSPYRGGLPKPTEIGSPEAESPPLTPGADYFYTEKDLELLKEVEEREAMKARLHTAKEPTRKPKKKINDLFSMLSKPETQSNEALELQKRAEQRAAQIAKEKNHTENLLSESDDLTHDERMRNKTINEIVSTERDFILDLEILKDLFYEPLLARNIISEQFHAAIFSNATLLFEINRNWLANLEKTIHLNSGPKISKCFSEMITYQKMYSDYCNNHTHATVTAMKLMKKNANFRQFIEDAQAHPRANGQPFVSYLIKPVQRICKYPLLVKELVKHEKDEEERASLERVLEKLSTVVTGINETKRDVDNMNKTIQIQKQLGIKHLELLQPGRQFVREGFFQEYIDGDYQMIYLALFNDLLLRGERRRAKFGTMRRNDRYHFTDQVPLYRAEITNIPNTADYSDSVKIKFTKRSSTVIIGSPQEKKDWLLDIQRLLINLDPSQSNSPPALKPQPELQVRARGHTRSQSIGTPPISTSSPDVQQNQSRTGSPLTQPRDSPSTPDVSNQQEAKIKCYVGKGTPEQRIRKVSLAGVGTVAQLFDSIRKEFEWSSGSQFCLSYEDQDGDVIEISSSISIWDILTESKCFFVNNLQQS